MECLSCVRTRQLIMFFFHVTVVFVTLVSFVNCEDYYELLGIQQSASTKEVRQAFKKLAVTMHPDKNQDDPEAHDKFLKINRAYEVLKDEDLRKKYDLHGEEGLKDDFRGGQRYESWKFYQEEFGLYDDDKEIITLSRSDFEQSVEGTADIWFINYYSPHCSHCHELAPAWREVAQELAGVIRIGAVNCEDEWHLCRMQGIRSYPTLIIYPSREYYNGERSMRQLVKFALKKVQADVHDIRTEEDLVNVGSVKCQYRKTLCENLGVEDGTYYYINSRVEKGEGKKITSLNAQDIAHSVLSWLPDVDNMDADTLQLIIDSLQVGQSEPWLLHFVEGDQDEDIELRKLPAMLEGIQIGRVNCQKLRSKCNQLHIKKFPSFVIYKETGGFEIYYGRQTAHDVSAFAKDSMNTRMESLTPTDFESHRVGPASTKMWFIDFFAPWCPPCMRLLPEFRKAARDYHDTNVGFGTVDCTIHNRLCQSYNIRSYPTTILYNNTIPHQYNGAHSAGHIVEFILDTMNPPVVILDEAMFQERVLGKKEEEIWLVDWFANWCGPCQQLAPEWRRLAKLVKENRNIHVGQVDCANPNNQWFCQNNNVHSYPTIRLYPVGPPTGSFFSYNGWNRDAQSLKGWAYDFLPSKVETITYQDFYNDVLPSTEPWVIDFFAPWCGHCQVFKPEFAQIAESVEGIARAGKVNCDEEPALCQQAGVHAYPTVKFYKGAKKQGVSQGSYGLDIENLDANYIVNYIKNRLQKKSHDEL